MKILTAQQIKLLESATIQSQTIKELDLVKRAGEVLAKSIISKLKIHSEFIFFCGTGKNGADGLICARILGDLGHKCKIYVTTLSESPNPIFLNILENIDQTLVPIDYINSINSFPKISSNAIIVDALIGTGLNKPLTGLILEIVEKINSYKSNKVIAIDLPTGMNTEGENISGNIIKADFTYTFESPKLNFLLAENYQFIGEWEILPIGLDQKYLKKIETNSYYIDQKTVKPILTKLHRPKFAHKGNFGHTLVVAGSKGKIGAAVLTTKAAVRIGSGLVTSYIPVCGYEILQISVPEAMVINSGGNEIISDADFDLNLFTACAIGPGLGIDKKTGAALENMIKRANYPIVLDADAINLISNDLSILVSLPKNSILTPHPKEFDRLVGFSTTTRQRLDKQRNFAKRYNVILVLKGAHTSIALPSGQVFFNSTGNPGMATGGSGDILTGVIAGLLSQGLKCEDAAILGVFIHGLAGDYAKSRQGEIGMNATDILEFIPRALKTLA